MFTLFIIGITVFWLLIIRSNIVYEIYIEAIKKEIILGVTPTEMVFQLNKWKLEDWVS